MNKKKIQYKISASQLNYFLNKKIEIPTPLYKGEIESFLKNKEVVESISEDKITEIITDVFMTTTIMVDKGGQFGNLDTLIGICAERISKLCKESK